MSLKTKPNKTSGSSPVFSYGDYTEMSNTPTQQDVINSGKTFKHSVMKTPFMSNQDYQSMEFEMSPGVVKPITVSTPSFKGIDYSAPAPLVYDIDKDEPKCDCNCGLLGNILQIEYWCMSCEKESYIFHAYVNNGQTTWLTGTDGDSIGAVGSFVPLPAGCPATSKRCVWATFYVTINCGEFNCSGEREVNINVCDVNQKMKIIQHPSCKVECGESLIIVNENGTPATDTILRNGTLDFKVTGCCGEVLWTVSVDSGSTLGGSTISGAGVLTAGATSCGSLKVTASCPACNTSTTQYVRVTNAGKWVQTSVCGYPGDGTTKTAIVGKYRYTCSWCCICDSDICTGRICDPSSGCTEGYPYTCCGFPKLGCGNPGTSTPAIGEVGGSGGCCNFAALITHVCHIIGNKVEEWQC